ncbi:MAG TPA: universal stress protein [Terriglobia bacterium]|nr:universal stress protein [Terriglobia bacterium]
MKILLAVDDSKFSQEALKALIRQISPHNAEVRVLHVVEPISTSAPPQMAAGYAPELESEMGEARRLVEKAAESLRDAGFSVETAVEQGDVRERIVDDATEWGADLIIAGSHGRRGIRRFLLGSVAESVARHAACSVEIVRSPRHE